MSVLAGLFEQARAQASLDGRRRRRRDALHGGRRLPARGGARWPSSSAHAAGRPGRPSCNDTFAVLRAGTEQGWGVAVVCGAGINCVGVAPDGRHVRFPALGAITGDWGGGYDVGLAAMSAAARSFDGRGPTTTLEQRGARALRPRHAARARRGDPRGNGSPSAGWSSLPPVVFAEAERDEVAARSSTGSPTRSSRSRASRSTGSGSSEVLLGGGLLQGDGLRASSSGSAQGCPGIDVRVTGAPPIVGAALLALDEVGRGRRRRRRGVRAELAGGGRWLRSTSGRRRASTPGTDAPAVDALDLDIAAGEFMVLVGPSGSGKTTALRMLAGLEEVDAGAIYIGDRDVTDLPAEGPRPGDGLPELRALPVPDRRREHRLPAQGRARARRPSASGASARWPSCSS